jgi:hypothetical protein
MALRAEDLLDSSCYSDLHPAYISPYSLPTLPTYVIPMASNDPRQAQVQPGPPQRSQRQRYVAPRHTAPSEQTSLPFYLPPAQPVPVLSSMSSDNETHNEVPEYEAQSYYGGVRGVNVPAPLFQYQPQLRYTIPYQSQPGYGITGFPFVLMQTTFPPRSELQNQTPYTTAPLHRPQPYFTTTAPTIQHAHHHHRDKRNDRAAHVEPLPAAVVDDKGGGELHSTPVLQRMSSGRFHDDDRRMYAKDLAPQLKQELALDISQSAILAERVFPTDSLPFPIDDFLLEHLARHDIWDKDGARFIKKPKSFSEDDLSEWLNILGTSSDMDCEYL